MLTNIAYTPETTISANGLNLVYDAFGDPGRDPILLIAGLGSPSSVGTNPSARPWPRAATGSSVTTSATSAMPPGLTKPACPTSPRPYKPGYKGSPSP